MHLLHTYCSDVAVRSKFKTARWFVYSKESIHVLGTKLTWPSRMCSEVKSSDDKHKHEHQRYPSTRPQAKVFVVPTFYGIPGIPGDPPLYILGVCLGRVQGPQSTSRHPESLSEATWASLGIPKAPPRIPGAPTHHVIHFSFRVSKISSNLVTKAQIFH